MRHRPLLAGAAALALALSLAACGDDGDEASTDTTEASEETSAETGAEETGAEETEAEDTGTETETETEDTTGDTEAEGEAPGDLTGLLVTAEDLGAGFTEADYETSTEPGPCGTAIDEEHPYEAIVGTVLVEEERELGLQHELRTYADEETAAATFAAAQEALSCGAETTQTGVILGAVTDVSESLGADAFAVEVASEDGTEGALVVVHVGPVLSVFQFVGPAGVEDGPDSLAIVTDNTAALQAELG